MKTIKTIYHRTHEMSREIKETKDGSFFFEERGDWYDDALGGLNQCIIDAYADMEYHASGQYSRDEMESKAYERQEQIFCGNW